MLFRLMKGLICFVAMVSMTTETWGQEMAEPDFKTIETNGIKLRVATMGEEKTMMVGHDWDGLVGWAAMLPYPDRFREVRKPNNGRGLSACNTPPGLPTPALLVAVPGTQ